MARPAPVGSTSTVAGHGAVGGLDGVALLLVVGTAMRDYLRRQDARVSGWAARAA